MTIAAAVKDNFVVFDHTASLSQVVGKLKELEKQAALIFKNNKFLGTIEKRKVLRTNTDLHEMHVEHFLHHVPIVEENTEILEAVNLLTNTSADFLPVEKDRSIVGVVSSVDLVKLALELPNVAKLSVKDIKYAKPAQINLTDNLATALEVMRTENIEVLPVFSQGKFTGIVGYKDVVRKLLGWSPKKDVSGKFNAELRSRAASVDVNGMGASPIENFATTENIISVPGNEPLKNALATLEQHKYTSLIVKDQGKYKGILTARNVLHSIAKLHKIDNFSIYFVGLGKLNLTENQQRVLDTITNREAKKLQRKLDQPFSLAIHVKEISKEGKQSLFNVNLKIDMNGHVQSCEKEDWDLETALHKCFNMLKTK